MMDTNSSHDKFGQIAKDWFGDPAIGLQLKSVVAEIAKYAHDSNQYGSPAQRKRKLGQAAAAAVKLINHLKDLDPTTRHALFGGGKIREHGDISQTGLQAPDSVLNADALSKLSAFEALLPEMAANAGNLVRSTSPQRAGPHELSDAVQFGVECLASFWRKYRDAVPTSGQNSDSFGNFAEAVLCATPVNASASNVRTALRYFFAQKNKDQPLILEAGRTASH